MKFTRKNAYDANNGGQFLHEDGSYTDLYWYAKAVGVMKLRPISDCTSWWFYAAIHGEYVVTKATDDDGNPVEGYPNWKAIPAIPASANLSSMDKPNSLTEAFWDQCQHMSWYFLPWHRGYLLALEIILHKIIVSLDGPSDWALPYWNYFKEGQNYIPPAFIALELPDGTPNPLYVEERYGPDGDGKPYATIINQSNPEDPENNYAIIEDCQESSNYADYVGKDSGGFAMFSKGSNSGKVERNPHNKVHNDMGGIKGKHIHTAIDGKEGLMCDQLTAALDPIFYIHHSNIDRMWAAWNETGGNQNPTDDDWLTGPAILGTRHFVMPIDKVGTMWIYTPKDTNTTTVNYYGDEKYEYTYDDLSLPPSKPQTLAATGKITTTMNTNNNPELFGASNLLTLNSGRTEAIVSLHKAVKDAVTTNLMANLSTDDPTNQVYLQLEGVKGINNSNSLAIYVNDIFVESVALFGIRGASMQNRGHGGLSFEFNITDIFKQLHIEKGLEDKLNVQIETRNPIMGEIKVGRISIYRVEQ